MKTVITSLALALLVTGTTLAEGDNKTDNKKTSLQTAVYPSAESTKLNVIINNTSGRSVSVRLLDAYGNALAQQVIGKASTSTKTRFDLSELEDGTYQVEISNGSTREVKQVSLKTKKPTVETYRSIAMN